MCIWTGLWLPGRRTKRLSFNGLQGGHAGAVPVSTVDEDEDEEEDDEEEGGSPAKGGGLEKGAAPKKKKKKAGGAKKGGGGGGKKKGGKHSGGAKADADMTVADLDKEYAPITG